MKANYYFNTIIISNSQIEILISISSSTNDNVNMSFPNSNFEGNFSTYVFGKKFLHYRELKIVCLSSRHILCEKKLNSLLGVVVRILVEKLNIYEDHIFSRPLLQTCRLERTTLCLNTWLRVNKKISFLIIFIEINEIVCLLCAHHVMTSKNSSFSKN